MKTFQNDEMMKWWILLPFRMMKWWNDEFLYLSEKQNDEDEISWWIFQPFRMMKCGISASRWWNRLSSNPGSNVAKYLKLLYAHFKIYLRVTVRIFIDFTLLPTDQIRLPAIKSVNASQQCKIKYRDFGLFLVALFTGTLIGISLFPNHA